MGTNVINHHLKKDDALRKNIRKEITSVFPPTTVAATDAVLSGLPPISNGHLGWTQYFEKEDTDLVVFLNVDFYTDKKFEVNLREKYLSFTKLYDQINNVNPNIVTKEYFPSFREGGSSSFSEQIEKVLITTHNVDKSFNYIYWTEPDHTEHVHGIYSDEVGDVLRNLNTDFTELINNIADNTIVICIADHGLTNIEEIPLFDYPDVTDLLERKPSIEPRAANFFVKLEKKMSLRQTSINTSQKHSNYIQNKRY